MSLIPDLSGMSDHEFEAERCRMINDYLLSLPKDVGRKMRLYQMNLDVERIQLQQDHGDKKGSEAFIQSCFKRIGENLENLSDTYGSLEHITNVKQPLLPNYADERKPKI